MRTVHIAATVALVCIAVGYAVLILGFQKPGYIRYGGYTAYGDASAMGRR